MNKAPHARCEACPLRDQPMVPPDWPNRSERFTLGDADHGGLAIVGEAPGAYEVAKGRPFVGRSGDLLNKHLARFGIDRRDVWMTNAVLCRPPDNKLSEYHKAVECCRPRLIAELRALKPEVVLAMGNAAKEALLPEVTEGITVVRGRDYYSEEIGARVRLTLHPAYVLRYPPADLD